MLRASAPLVLGCLVGALAGCGNGGGGRPTPTPGPTATGAPTATSAPEPTPTPAPADPSFPIAIDVREPAGVGVAFGAGRWLVAYGALGEGGEHAVLGRRLDEGGEVVDAAPLDLSDLGAEPFLSSPTAFYGLPSVAFDGAAFGVFFFGDGPVRNNAELPGQVVSFTPVSPHEDAPAGATALVEQATFSQARTSLGPPVVASGAEGRFVELHRRHFTLVGSSSFSDLPGNFVEVVDDGGLEVRETAAVSVEFPPPDEEMVLDTTAAGVAFGAGRTLAAWVEIYRATDGDAARVQGAWIAPEAQPVRLPLAATTLGSQGVAVASDGARFLVVWTAAASDGASALTEVRGLHFTPDADGDGMVDPPGGFVIAGGDAAKTLGGVAFGGGSYLVAWLEDDAARGAHVAPGGAPGSPFTIDAGPASDVGLASDGERFLAAFVRTPGSGPAEVRGTFAPAAD